MRRVEEHAFRDGGSECVSVTFTDLPGCAAYGETMDEAVAYASGVLGQHSDVLGESGEEIPVPSSIMAIDHPLASRWFQRMPLLCSPDHLAL